MKFRAIAVAVAASVLAIGSTQTPAVAESPGADRAALQQAMNDFVASGVTGVQLRVRDQSGSWTGTAGVAEVDRPEGVPTDGRFRVGSITKMFTATVILQLVGEGRLGLDDPVDRYLPQFGLDPRITVRMILRHTSGLRSHTGGSSTDGEPDPVLIDSLYRTYEPDELVRFVTAQPLRFEPGTDWSYSNTNYVLAGLLIEKLTSTPYALQVYLRIVAPLGLWRTELPGTSMEILGPHAHGYLPYEEDGVAKLFDISRMNPSLAWAAGEIISTTEDLDSFLAALLSGRLLSPALWSEMRNLYRFGDSAGYGLALLELDHGDGCVSVGHDGRMPGYSSSLRGTPDGSARVEISVTEGSLPTLGDVFQLSLAKLASAALCGTAAPAAQAVGARWSFASA